MDRPMQPSADLTAKAIQVGKHLDQLGILRALTGGLALAFWGFPRSTIDVDIIIALSQQSYDQLKSEDNTLFIMQPDEMTMPPHEDRPWSDVGSRHRSGHHRPACCRCCMVLIHHATSSERNAAGSIYMCIVSRRHHPAETLLAKR